MKDKLRNHNSFVNYFSFKTIFMFLLVSFATIYLLLRNQVVLTEVHEEMKVSKQLTWTTGAYEKGVTDEEKADIAHMDCWRVTKPNSNDTLAYEPFYSDEDLKMLKDLEKNIADSNELQKLIKYANDNYDIPAFKKFFEENGYLIFKPKIDPVIFQAAKDFTIAIDREGPALRSGNWTRGHTCPQNPGSCIHDRYDQKGVVGLAEDWSTRAVIAAVHGMTPYTFQSLNYPRSSLAFTHSDYVHFGTYPPNAMTAVWVALEDIHKDAGPLFYYPGSHKMPFLNMQDLSLKTVQDGQYPAYQAKIESIAEHMGYKRATFVPKKGEALMWHANLLHGGPLPINPGITRLSQVVHYHFYEMEYGWQPVASRLDQNKVKFIDAVGVHQKWGRLPPNSKGKYNEKSKFGSCYAFPHSPCFMNSLEIGLTVVKNADGRCSSGHGLKSQRGANC